MKTLGPANDSDPNVQIEIRAAAELFITDAEWYGWLARKNGHEEGILEFGSDWQAGWLAGEMAMFEIAMFEHYERDAWPWDPSRPVAGQYEEWRAAADIAALEAVEAKLSEEPK